MKYIDIHNHFAWGIDDGIETKEETRTALKKAQVEGKRVCMFQDIYELLQKEIGKENADILCYRNAKHIIENEEVEEIEVKKKRWWKRR